MRLRPTRGNERYAVIGELTKLFVLCKSIRPDSTLTFLDVIIYIDEINDSTTVECMLPNFFGAKTSHESWFDRLIYFNQLRLLVQCCEIYCFHMFDYLKDKTD